MAVIKIVQTARIVKRGTKPLLKISFLSLSPLEETMMEPKEGTEATE
jgi:hypothetical protein